MECCNQAFREYLYYIEKHWENARKSQKKSDLKNEKCNKKNMKKQKGNTGFRNGDLFCFNCGNSYKIPYPQPVTMASALITQFSIDHEKCLPTWVEPANESE